MKAKCLQEIIHRALQITSRVTPGRTSMPILQNTLIQAQGEMLHLVATNLEMTVRMSLPATIEREGSLAVPNQLLRDFISALPRDVVELEQAENSTQMKLTCGLANANINSASADLFPPCPEVGSSMSITLTAEEFKKAVGRVAFCTASDNGRPVLTGILLHLEDGQLTTVGADGLRVAIQRTTLEKPSETPSETPLEILWESPWETPWESPLEIPLEITSEAPPEIPLEITSETPPEIPLEITSETTPEIPLEITSETTPEIPLEITSETTPEIPLEITSEIPLEITSEIPLEITSEIPLEISLEIPLETPSGINTRVVVPAHVMNEVQRIVSNNGEQVEIVIPADKRHVRFRIGSEEPQSTDIEVISQVLVDSYPNYQGLIPEEMPNQAVFILRDLESAIRRAALFAKDNQHTVRFDMSRENGKERTIISSESKELGNNRAELPINNMQGSNIVIAFNNKFIQDALSVLGSKKVRLETNNRTTPVKITIPEEDDYVHVFMPILTLESQ